VRFIEREVLKILRESRGYVSGTDIAAALGISRALVNRIVGKLKSLGFVIEAHPRRGYALLEIDDLSRAPEYAPRTPTIEYRIHYIERCTSTQDVAEDLARAQAPEGTVIVAEEMSCGRGRLGRKWFAPRGGLWFTIILRPGAIERLHLLSLAAGVAVAEALNEMYSVSAGLKWPNDVVVGGKKLCGILVEAKAEADRVLYVLLGIGINVNNDIPPELRDQAIALREVLGRNVPRVELLRGVLISFAKWYSALKGRRYRDIVDAWKRHSATLGKRVRARLVTGEVVEGIAIDVDGYGRLVMRGDDGSLRYIDAGDIEHLG